MNIFYRQIADLLRNNTAAKVWDSLSLEGKNFLHSETAQFDSNSQKP